MLSAIQAQSCPPSGSGTNPVLISSLGCVIVPMQFLVVNGKRNGSQVLINWEVINEYEVINYFIERSSNGNDFVTAGLVGNIPGNGNISKYTFSDALAGKKARVFYRIKAQDAAGQSIFSKTITVQPVLKEGAPRKLMIHDDFLCSP
jgi:hypothetical protein